MDTEQEVNAHDFLGQPLAVGDWVAAADEDLPMRGMMRGKIDSIGRHYLWIRFPGHDGLFDVPTFSVIRIPKKKIKVGPTDV